MDEEDLEERVTILEQRVDALLAVAEAQAELLKTGRGYDRAVAELMKAHKQLLGLIGHRAERVADRRRS